jgi:hypothetical protein
VPYIKLGIERSEATGIAPANALLAPTLHSISRAVHSRREHRGNFDCDALPLDDVDDDNDGTGVGAGGAGAGGANGHAHFDDDETMASILSARELKPLDVARARANERLKFTSNALESIFDNSASNGAGGVAAVGSSAATTSSTSTSSSSSSSSLSQLQQLHNHLNVFEVNDPSSNVIDQSKVRARPPFTIEKNQIATFILAVRRRFVTL